MKTPQKTNDQIIAIEGVKKNFGDVTALDGVSLNIREGEFFSLLGPSGCGKTTLLRMISGFDSPSIGSVYIGGSDMTNVPPNERPTNMVFQSYAIFPHLNVAENVGYGLKKQKLSDDKINRRVEEALALVDLEGFGARESHALSGGQRQRVAIARALVNRPKVILADEPTASLDKESGRDVAQLIQQLAREEGASVVLVTHDNRILDIADRILHLEDGHMKELREALAGEASRALGVLAEHDPEAHRNLLLFSKALARVANSDRDIADEEVEVIRRVLSEEAALSTGEVDFVVSLAVAQVRSETADEGPAGDALADEQKQRLRAALQAVAEADGELTAPELEEISRIEAELSL